MDCFIGDSPWPRLQRFLSSRERTKRPIVVTQHRPQKAARYFDFDLEYSEMNPYLLEDSIENFANYKRASNRTAKTAFNEDDDNFSKFPVKFPERKNRKLGYLKEQPIKTIPSQRFTPVISSPKLNSDFVIRDFEPFEYVKNGRQVPRVLRESLTAVGFFKYLAFCGVV